jgi:hypothetical protein
MSAFDTIASDDFDGSFVAASLPSPYGDLVSNRSIGPELLGPATPSQRPDLEAIFHLHEQIMLIARLDVHGGLSADGQRALLLFLVDNICSALRVIRADESKRRYVLELQGEEALKMLEVLQTVSVFTATGPFSRADATIAVA